MSGRRLTAVKWLAVGCVAVGVWLLAIGILYTNWPAIALAIVAIVFGMAGVTTVTGRPHTRAAGACPAVIPPARMASTCLATSVRHRLACDN